MFIYKCYVTNLIDSVLVVLQFGISTLCLYLMSFVQFVVNSTLFYLKFSGVFVM